MNHIIRSIALACAAALTATVLAACGGDNAGSDHQRSPTGCLESNTGPVALLASGRQNSPAARLDGPVRSLVADAIDHGRTIYLVNVDGKPNLLRKFSFPNLPSNSSRTAEIDASISRVAAALAAVRADDPQVDDLAALTLGAGLVRDQDGTVVLLDNGLQTVAPNDFTQPGVLGAQPDDIAKFLTTSRQQIDLHGVAAGFAGLGATTAPQQPLTNAQSTNLKAIYTRIAATSGARCTQIVDIPFAATPVPSDQSVSVVPIPSATPFTATAPLRAPIVLDSTVIAFQPDTADLVDPAAARSTVQPLIDALRRDRTIHATLTGTCASGSDRTGPDPIQLSTARAATIATLLTTAGVPATQLTSLGVGTTFPEFTPDLDTNGNLLPGPAARNRSVRITFN